VHIDDRIPCDRKGRPVYARGKDVNETWVMILEKAYAKLHGCYDNLKTGYIDYGLRDLTGGACIKFKWTDKPTAVCCSSSFMRVWFAWWLQPLVESGELYNLLRAALEEGSLAGCSFNTGDESATESDRGDGILAVRCTHWNCDRFVERLRSWFSSCTCACLCSVNRDMRMASCR
jgi:hypothetical protein